VYRPRFYVYICSFITCLQLLRGLHNFWGADIDQPAPTEFGTKAVIVTYSPNPSCVPNLELLASTVAEISRGSHNFWDAPVAPTPANFGPKCCFLVRFQPNPTCVPNLKLLASTVAEISMGSQNFWDAPIARPPANSKRPILAWFHVLWTIARQNPSTGLTCRPNASFRERV